MNNREIKNLLNEIIGNLNIDIKLINLEIEKLQNKRDKKSIQKANLKTQLKNFN